MIRQKVFVYVQFSKKYTNDFHNQFTSTTVKEENNQENYTNLNRQKKNNHQAITIMQSHLQNPFTQK